MKFKIIYTSIIALICYVLGMIGVIIWLQHITDNDYSYTVESKLYWNIPTINMLNNNADAKLIIYGQQLVSNTAVYLGPKGSVMHISNGMNCQNCHLEAGTKIFGNNYSAVAANYPKFRDRSGTIESIPKRVNDCLERSLNGKSLDTNSREMKAFVAYIKWLGKDVPKNKTPYGAGIANLTYLNRAANPKNGKIIFLQQCARCHGSNGQGMLYSDKRNYQYPPVWGNNSYNTAAGLFRISRLAGYIKDNMPYGVRYDSSVLTEEEAWDVAAYINSQPRPHKAYKLDWPNIYTKPIDYPFGPYADNFLEQQHKYGPFKPIQLWKESRSK